MILKSGGIPDHPPSRVMTSSYVAAPYASLTPSIHPAFPSRPVGIAQMAAQDLAGGIARQGFDEVDRLRCLEARDAFAGEADDIRRGRLPAGLHHHDRLDGFAPFVVGHADHGDFGHVRMVADRAFAFGGIDILAAGDDHVLDAVVDIEIAVLEIGRASCREEGRSRWSPY